VYGTGAVVPALIAAGVKPGKPAIRRAVAWLEEHQNADGGWGEDMRSYDDPGFAGRGESTASQTAWALLALLAAGEGDSAAPSRAHGTPGLDTTSRPAAPDARQVSTAVERGVQWLTDHQREDGTWDEPQYTGTGFPRDFYLNYHLYRLVFPVTALGRYVAGTS
jgi:squalene-hopene/tetraprenyl-beta-curcumene cyclase